MKLRITYLMYALAVIAVLFIAFAITIAVYNSRTRVRLDSYNALLRTELDLATGIRQGCAPKTVLPKTESGKPAVLFLHGYLSTPQDFNDLPAILVEQGYPVRMALHPGHGRFPADLETVTASDYVSHALAEYDALQGQYGKVAVVGFSMGGALAAQLAFERDPCAVVLLAPCLDIRYDIRRILPVRTINRLFAPHIPYVGRSEHFFCVNDRSAIGKYFTYMFFPTQSAEQLCIVAETARNMASSRKSNCPILGIQSVNDTVVSLSATRAFFSSLEPDSSRLVLVSASNHMLCFDFDRTTVITEVTDFLPKR